MKRVVIAGDLRVEYTLVQTVRRSVLFQALPRGEVRVYAPKTMRLRDIDAMVRERAEQLKKMGQSVDQRVADTRREHPVIDGTPFLIEGERCVLRLSPAARISARIGNGEFQLSLLHPEREADVRAAIRSVLSTRALERIRERLAVYGPRIGQPYGRVTIREQKSRWGSCSSKHNLNFNWKLIMAPPQVLDYVVIHELCHLIEFNHSPRFWALVEAQQPDYKVWKQWLKDHTEDLYL